MSKGAIKRLQKEFLLLNKEPVPHIFAKPNPSNLLEWHFIISGPPGTPYEGGQYHGKLIFPSEYPFKPPGIMMITPSGRFETERRLCLSMSDFHPESWNPLWSVGSILTGLLSFMLEETQTTGSIVTSLEEKKTFAGNSKKFNESNPVFVKNFSDLVGEKK
eukprot:TRINITY_DN2701_c0_g1_i2.p1 TRINITY_DN2701_c0_g1~~TRINITY_DN2701_c0_g1_i2.p1  ORF type:complete len:161 (+),score=41.52 TRINITY_DN2701_c0_g1_i2:124-606(+)